MAPPRRPRAALALALALALAAGAAAAMAGPTGAGVAPVRAARSHAGASWTWHAPDARLAGAVWPQDAAAARPAGPAQGTPTPAASPSPPGGGVTLPGAAVRRLATDFVFTEGPAADASGDVYFTDVRTSRIHRWSTDGALTVHREDTGGANGLYFDRDGTLVVCEGGNRRLVRDDLQGNVVVLADGYGGRRLNSPNDVWVHPGGGIYVSDPRYGDASNVE